MSQQQIIRHVTTLDRHIITVTTEQVIEAIGALTPDVWTTRDVAKYLEENGHQVKEQAVRATIKKLKRMNLIRRVGLMARNTTTRHQPYRVIYYEICLPSAPVDFVLLNRVLCGR